MNTVLLQYAVEVEKTGSITQAAANLYMDQPNLSKAIKSLEESLGAPIFRRTPKGVVPTERGRVFLEYARNVLVQIEEMEHLYKPNQVTGIDFSLSMPRASYISLACTRFIQTLTPEESMSVWLRETNTADTLRDVATGEYRIGIIRLQASSETYYRQVSADKGLVMEPLFDYTLRLLFSFYNPLAEKKEIEPADLNPYIEISHGDGVSSQRGGSEREKNLPDSAKRIFVFERGSQFDLLCENPDTYMWVSPMPPQILKRYDLVERQCSRKTPVYQDALIYRKGYSLTLWEKKFIKELGKFKSLFCSEC
ncbi:LysR family transcriptional regulator [Lacrimispora sp. JR3]|uniref:LysR family transcriptional regulator n=1 Tax=Lacrimispora sinapis TaxID=3111456 RepID=UPI00374972EF